MSPSSDAALKEEIARLTGAINWHKSTQQPFGSTFGLASNHRSNTYVNPNYKPPSSYRSQAYQSSNSRYVRPPPSMKPEATTQAQPSTRDVVIDGVAFESSTRSLVRKDLPKPASSAAKAPAQDFSRTTNGHRIPAARAYKSKVSSRARRPRARNMTLDNTWGPTQSVGRRGYKRMKYIDKPCPRFTTTGTCSRGLTCVYQHDADKIAICWNFLHGNCSNTAETCNLSHDPTLERTPLCVHFANNGRCTRDNCPFPHVRVGQRHGVCRDFAVLGYCAKGLDCEMQHVRECPDFAEKGTCSTKGCKLPHVIRANRNRKPPPMTIASATSTPAGSGISGSSDGSDNVSSSQFVSVKDAQLGDEFISLVFNESEDEHDDDSDEDEDDVDDDDAEEENEEGISPTTSPLY
ncbi:hypothetical protein SCLCIDRAFT_119208 [Scleroderma citrinum Foug A]|uniref:C3H1-type domain-containing protein n=1 Tax=Scleroderma citrinum Foug A TaxID=1036808 RepID=A0A0C3DPU5_9AGAM|nr:hypothetical protein SCLCIDRAFT_119208 [Scleroderma citrinum Foug A]